MNYAIAKAARDAIAAEYDAACKALKSARGDAPSNAFGLTPDHIKASPEYRAAWNLERRLFGALRMANSDLVRARKQVKA